MFIPDHFFSPDGMKPYAASIPRVFHHATTQFREFGEVLLLPKSKIGSFPWNNVTGLVSLVCNGDNVNEITITNEERTALLHGNRRGFAFGTDPALERRCACACEGGTHRHLPATAPAADPGQASRADAPVSYTLHPLYGYLPIHTPYLAVLASRVAL